MERMIIKVSPIHASEKSQFGKLVDYIAKPKDNNAERVEKVWLDNFGMDDTLADAKLIVQSAHAQKVDVKKAKTYHVIISFRPEEAAKLTEEDYAAIAKEVAESVKLGSHERITALHGDTNNRHLHLAINLLDEQNRIKHPAHDFKIFKEKRHEIEKRYGFEQAEKGAEILTEENMKRERHGNTASFERWLKENVAAKMESLLEGGSNWSEVHKMLAENGAEIRKRGAGFVFSNKEETVFIKASKVSRNFSISAITKKLGEFVPSDQQTETKRKFKSASIIGKELYEQYKKEAGELKKRREEERSKLDQEQKAVKAKVTAEIKNAKEVVLKLPTSQQKSVKLKLLTLQRAKLMEKIAEERQDKAKKIAEKYRHKTWLIWLQEKAKEGDSNAIETLQRRKVEVFVLCVG